LLKLKRIVNTVYDMIDSEYTFLILDLCRLLTFILALNHVIACSWFAIGSAASRRGDQNWLENSEVPVLQEPVVLQYTTALHWSLTQFTPASMDVSARNTEERVFSITVLFFALVAFGSIVGSVTSSMTLLRKLKEDSVKQFWMLRRYMKQNGISHSLNERIVKFLEHCQEIRSNQVDEKSVMILSGLSVALRCELFDEMHRPHLQLHPLMAYIGHRDHMPFVMYRLCSECVRVFSCAMDDVIFSHGDGAAWMYFVRNGSFTYALSPRASVNAQSERSLQDPLPLNVKAWVSEAVLWTTWQHRGTLRATMPGDLLLLDPDAFAQVMSIHPRPWRFAQRYAARSQECSQR